MLIFKIIILFNSLFLIASCKTNIENQSKSDSSPIHKVNLPKDSIRYVIHTFYFDIKTNTGKSVNRIIDLNGKVYGEWWNNYTTPQNFDCLNFNTAKLYLFSGKEKKMFSIDRNGKATDISDKYFGLSSIGQNFVELRLLKKEEGSDIYNNEGKFMVNIKDIIYSTEYSDNIISVFNAGSWEIRDTSWNLIYKFSPKLITQEIYPNKGLYASKEGLIRIDRGIGNCYFVNKYGEVVIDIFESFKDDIVLSVQPPSKGIILVNHESIEKSTQHWTYIDTLGNIIWTTSIENGERANSFSGDYAQIIYDGLKIENKKTGTISVETKSKYINRKGEVVTNIENHYPRINRKGHLHLTHTKLRTLDNRMNGYAIVDTNINKIIFESEWPIVFFDENVVIVGDKDVYENRSSENLVVYNYQKGIIWKTPKL